MDRHSLRSGASVGSSSASFRGGGSESSELSGTRRSQHAGDGLVVEILRDLYQYFVSRSTISFVRVGRLKLGASNFASILADRVARATGVSWVSSLQLPGWLGLCCWLAGL